MTDQQYKGKDDPTSLDGIINSAELLFNNGNYGGADLSHRQVLNISEKTVGLLEDLIY